jgi:hypothetical protein
MAGRTGTTIYEKRVEACPICGEPGDQVVFVKYYYPRTNRFGKKREYRVRAIRHRKGGKYKVCILENLSPSIYKKS